MDNFTEAEKYNVVEYANIQQSDNLAAQAMLFKAEIYLKQKKYEAAIEVMSKALVFLKSQTIRRIFIFLLIYWQMRC